jgi:hypothetical protein
LPLPDLMARAPSPFHFLRALLVLRFFLEAERIAIIGRVRCAMNTFGAFQDKYSQRHCSSCLLIYCFVQIESYDVAWPCCDTGHRPPAVSGANSTKCKEATP